MERKGLVIGRVVYWAGVLMTLFHVVTLVFFPLPASAFRTCHMMFVTVMIFLTYPTLKGDGKGKTWIVSVVFLFLGIAAFVYAFFELENVLARGGIWTTNADIVFGVIAILVVLEAARRSNGLALPLIAVAFLLYALFGNYIPGMLGHTGYSIKRIITSLYTYDGIFGTALDTAATFVSMFIIFAAFLEKTGSGDVFLELAKSIAGKSRGGPAKVAVIACALFGTISGSAVACVAATGSIIIPLMIRMGYDRTLSGAAVSAASIGGQIMPPVMAAGAFLMAEFLGVKYIDVIKAALIPAVMYFFTIWVSIDCKAGKINLKGLSKDQIPSLVAVLKKDWLILMPLILLIVMLVVLKYSAITCAFYSMIASVVVCFFDKERRMGLVRILDTMAFAAKGIAPVAAACACAGIVIGVISLTGLGIKISTLIISLSGGRVIFALILSMVTAIIFGMGLPTTVSYILCVSVLAPVLIEMGIVPMAAHMFIFYFACLSGITPPVALAAYTGAGIANTSPIKTAAEGSKLAIIAFFLPYMFVFNTAFLMDGSFMEILWAVVIGIASCYSIAGFTQGWLIRRLNLPLRGGFFVAAAMLMWQNRVFDYVGLLLFAVLMVVLFVMRKRDILNINQEMNEV